MSCSPTGLIWGLVAALHCVLHDEGRYISTVDWREGTVPYSQCCSSQDTGHALLALMPAVTMCVRSLRQPASPRRKESGILDAGS